MTKFSLACRRGACLTAAAFALFSIACTDATTPRTAVPDVRILITPLADAAFEGDTVAMHASVLDRLGNPIPGASLVWSSSDTTLARVVTATTIALLKPGVVRISAQSGAASQTIELTIGHLVVDRVELAPDTLNLGRGDRVQVMTRAFGQGGREITGRTLTFASNDVQVALIGSPDNIVGHPGFLIAVGPGQTTITATIDGVTGTARVGVVVADTTLTLTQFNGSPIPALVAADSVEFNGQMEFDEVYADSGTLVLSGLLQERYNLTVRVSQYHVIRTGDTVQRELRIRVNAEVDRGVVTTRADGSLSMLSELIGPHLEHTATPTADGFLVHYQEPGSDSFLDLTYKRVTP